MMWCSFVVLSMCSLQGATPAAEANGLHFDTPAMVWDEALPLGNGILGALVWGDGKPLNISLDRTDLWDLRPVPEFHSDEYTYTQMRQWEKEGRYDDLKRIYEQPYRRPAPTKIPAGRICVHWGDESAFASADLDVSTAAARVSFTDGASARVWISATEPVGIMELSASEPPRLELIAPAFGGKEDVTGEGGIVAGELAQLGYPPPKKSSGDTFAAYEQEGWEGFRFAVYLGWRHDAGSGKTRAAWSVASGLESDESPLDRAKQRVDAALDGQLDALERAHRSWWDAYWKKTWLRVPNKRIERQWYLDTYKFGAAARADAPPITLQGPWTADNGKLPPWKGDYHHDCNTEMSYWPSYSGNRLEGEQGFVDWLWNARTACVDWTRRFFDMPGMAVPMTTDLNCNQIGGWRQYTHSATTGAWLAQHFYWHWKFTADEGFLATRAYPYVRDCAVFLDAVTNERGEDGLRTLPLSSSPEYHDNSPKAWFPTITNNDLALIRWLLGAAVEMAERLGKDDDAAYWRAVLSEMPELSRGEDGALLVAKEHPVPASHRHHSHLMAIYPLGIVDSANGEEDRRTIEASLANLERHGTSQWVGFSFPWMACLAARGHDGERAAKALDIFAEAFVLRNGFNCNGDQSGKGYSNFTYRPFTLEANFASAAGLQEMLLQSHTGIVEVFPAVPESWKDIAFHQLRAQGGFLVSAEKQGGALTSLNVTAEHHGTLRLRLPGSADVHAFELEKGQTLDVLAAL